MTATLPATESGRGLFAEAQMAPLNLDESDPCREECRRGVSGSWGQPIRHLDICVNPSLAEGWAPVSN